MKIWIKYSQPALQIKKKENDDESQPFTKRKHNIRFLFKSVTSMDFQNIDAKSFTSRLFNKTSYMKLNQVEHVHSCHLCR